MGGKPSNMKITIRQLKRLIKEAVSDNENVKQEFFRHLDKATESGHNPNDWSDSLFTIEEITPKSLWAKLKDLYSDDEILELAQEEWFNTTKCDWYSMYE